MAHEGSLLPVFVNDTRLHDGDSGVGGTAVGKLSLDFSPSFFASPSLCPLAARNPGVGFAGAGKYAPDKDYPHRGSTNPAKGLPEAFAAIISFRRGFAAPPRQRLMRHACTLLIDDSTLQEPTYALFAKATPLSCRFAGFGLPEIRTRGRGARMPARESSGEVIELRSFRRL